MWRRAIFESRRDRREPRPFHGHRPQGAARRRRRSRLRRAAYPFARRRRLRVLLSSSSTACARRDTFNRPALGVPTQPLDPVYATECGACHVALSSKPRAGCDLAHDDGRSSSDHFGEDASLDPARPLSDPRLSDANSAEPSTHAPANVFRRRNADDPLSITATSFWRHRHARIPDRVFASPAVGSRGNCRRLPSADAATGLFRPAEIAIPKDTEP